MPEKDTMDKAKKDKREGKAPSTQAGEFVREEIDHVREGKHGARSSKQAIAIGLSKARRAGVDVPDAKNSAHKKSATRKKTTKAVSATRSKATKKALKREPHNTVSKASLSKQAKASAKKRGPTARKKAAKKAARTRARAA